MGFLFEAPGQWTDVLMVFSKKNCYLYIRRVYIYIYTYSVIYFILWIHDTICIFMCIYIYIYICMCIYVYMYIYIYMCVFKCFANSREYHSLSWCCAGFWCPSQGWRRADSYTSMVWKRRANWGPHCYHSSLIETVAKMECWAPIKHPEQPVSIQRVQRGFKDEYQPIILYGSFLTSKGSKVIKGHMLY